MELFQSAELRSGEESAASVAAKMVALDRELRRLHRRASAASGELLPPGTSESASSEAHTEAVRYTYSHHQTKQSRFREDSYKWSDKRKKCEQKTCVRGLWEGVLV